MTATDTAEVNPLQKVFVTTVTDNTSYSKWCITVKRVASPFVVGTRGLIVIVSMHVKSSDIRGKKVLKRTCRESFRYLKVGPIIFYTSLRQAASFRKLLLCLLQRPEGEKKM